MDWGLIVFEATRSILDKLVIYSSKIFFILVILIIGWFIAKLMQRVVTRFLKIVPLDTLADKAQITKILINGGIKYTLSELIGILFYWSIILIVCVAAVNALNLTIAAQLLNQIVTYVPSVIAAVFVLAVGIFVSSLASGAVNTVAVNAGISQAKLLAKITQVAILAVVIIMALEQLKIATTILNLIVPIILAAIGLALAIAFGLGGKDIAAKIIKDALDKLK